MRTFFLKLLMWKLRLMAGWMLRRYKPGIVAITGSVGKTSTKEAIRAVVARTHSVRVAPKSFNNDLGVPLTILGDWREIQGNIWWWGKTLLASCGRLLVGDRAYPEALILEYGVDRPGDMDRLVHLARPDVAVMTAIGDLPPVHVEFFSGPEAVFHEKAKIIKALAADGFAVLNADDEKILSARNLTRARAITFGFSGSADVRVSNLTRSLEGDEASLRFKFNHDGTVVPVRIPNALSRADAYAAAAAAAVGIVFGMNLVEIAAGLETYMPPPGRSRPLAGVNGSILIDSTYNASPLALHEALQTLGELSPRSAAGKTYRKIAVLGDMLELGKFTVAAHGEAGRRAAKVADALVTVGHRAKFMAESALAAGMGRGKVHAFLTLADAADYLCRMLRAGDLVLFKASQGVRLERALKRCLAEPAHAGELLVRQEKVWLAEKGLYDEGELS